MYSKHRCNITYPGVGLPGRHVKVGQIIANLVVVLVVPLASNTTKQVNLFLRLDALGTRAKAPGGDAIVNKTDIVAAAIKLVERVVETLGAVPVDEQVAQLLRAGRVAVVGRVVDLVGKVGAREHVEVDKDADLLVLGGRERVGVIGRAEQALLLGGPPGEADAVVDLELCELDGNLEDRDAAGAVVVDARAGGDAVAVAAEHDAVVRVAALGLGDDVVRQDGLDGGVDVGNGVDAVAVAQLLGQRLAAAAGDAKGGDLVGLGVAEGAANVLVFGVVDDGRLGARLAGELGLDAKGAVAALDEGDALLDGGRIVGGVAARVVDEGDAAVDGLLVLGGRRAGEGLGVVGYAVANDELGLVDGAGVDGELLGRDVVVFAECLKRLGNVFNGSLVACEESV